MAPVDTLFGELTQASDVADGVTVEVSAVDAEPGALEESLGYACELVLGFGRDTDEPERLLLDALASEHGLDATLLLRPLVADLTAIATLGQARGVCVNVDGHVRVGGVPPRPAGWLVEVGAGVHRQRLGLVEGGVADLDLFDGGRAVAVAGSAYEAFVAVQAVAAGGPPAAGAQAWLRSSAGDVRATEGFAAFVADST